MANFPATSDGGNGSYQNTEHYLKRVLIGNVASVRVRLSAVLERLDYDFIYDEGEFEIQAKRGVLGWAGSYASADVLDYTRTLIIKLKPLSENSTRASFAYIVKHPSLNRGEKDVLTREAETIAQLATARATDKVCAVCGTESSDDSRFCRKCGSPMTGDETSIEVLRMTAEIRSGHTSVVTSAFTSAAAALVAIIALVSLLANGAVVKPVLLFLSLSIVFSLLNVLIIGFGWNRLNNAIKSKNKEQKIMPGETAQSFSRAETPALQPQPASFSVIENTTELLNTNDEKFAFVERDDVKRQTGNL